MPSPGAVIANPGMPVAMPVAIPVSTSSSPKHSGSSSDGECVQQADVWEIRTYMCFSALCILNTVVTDIDGGRGRGLLSLTCCPPVTLASLLSPSWLTES